MTKTFCPEYDHDNHVEDGDQSIDDNHVEDGDQSIDGWQTNICHPPSLPAEPLVSSHTQDMYFCSTNSELFLSVQKIFCSILYFLFLKQHFLTILTLRRDAVREINFVRSTENKIACVVCFLF